MTPKYYAGAMPYHKEDRDRLLAMVRASGNMTLEMPVPTPDHIPMPCLGCGMALSIGPTLQTRILETPGIECICPLCMAAEQRITKQQVTVENVESDHKMILCSCGTSLQPGERCSKCWREAKEYGT